jgi:hydrogenase expression/formation protein HypD
MKYVNDFRDKELAEKLCKSIEKAAGDHQYKLMEVCGTHTMSVHKHGLHSLIPKSVELISGPGCPVCVTNNDYIDFAVAVSRLPEHSIVTFGDMIRVPGSSSSLSIEKSKGRDVRVVYSPTDAIDMAEKERNRTFVFLGIGFETTAPLIAASIKEANERDLGNFCILTGHKTMPEPMEYLASSPDLSIDGFMCPGHVSTVIGTRPYEPIAQKHGKPCVIAGFEPLDILQTIHMLVLQLEEDRSEVEVQYSRVTRPEGNLRALEILYEVFEKSDSSWRGLGTIEKSGLAIKPQFDGFDARVRLNVDQEPTRERKDCRCGEVLKGIIKPYECQLFGRECTPADPVGACMVSREGSCRAHYQYSRKEDEQED